MIGCITDDGRGGRVCRETNLGGIWLTRLANICRDWLLIFNGFPCREDAYPRRQHGRYLMILFGEIATRVLVLTVKACCGALILTPSLHDMPRSRTCLASRHEQLLAMPARAHQYRPGRA